MSRKDDPREPPDELKALQGKDGSSSEDNRIGMALRNRHALKMRAVDPSPEELGRIKQRLSDDGFHETSLIAASTGKPWFKSLFHSGRSWGLGLTAAAIAGLLITQGKDPHILKNLSDESDPATYRSLDITRLQRAYPELPLAGHQFQIVKDTLQAEAEWKTALIETGLPFKTHRSTDIPGGIEIHIALSAEHARLDRAHALRKAPDQGEWLVILIPESP